MTGKDQLDSGNFKQNVELITRAIETAPVGVIITDPTREENPIIYANERFEELTGYSEAEVLGRNCRFLQGEQTAPEPVAEMRHAVDNAEPVTVELRNYRKDGTEFWNRVTIAPVQNASAEVTHFVGFQQDITEHKEYEQSLERSTRYRRQVHQITSNTNLSTGEKIHQLLELGCDRLNVENGHIVHIDTERERHRIMKTGGSEFVEPGTVTNLSETFCRKTMQQDGILAIYNAPAQGWGDDPAYTQWDIGCYIGAKLRVQEDLYGTVCFVNQRPRESPFTQTEQTFVDLMSRWLSHVFERQEHERKHELDSQRLDVAQRVLRHNLRNKLTVIQGQAELISMSAGEQSDAVAQIIETVDELSDLTDKARLLSEFDERVGGTLTPVDVTESVTAIVETFRAEYPAAIISCSLPNEMTITLPDERRFNTAVTNTIENALEHTEVSDPVVEVSATHFENHVEIQIQDDGSGIPVGEREVLEEGEETPLQHGSGLGLWLIHWCMTTLDGDVRFEERDTGGSCVTLAFPQT